MIIRTGSSRFVFVGDAGFAGVCVDVAGGILVDLAAGAAAEDTDRETPGAFERVAIDAHGTAAGFDADTGMRGGNSLAVVVFGRDDAIVANDYVLG